MDCELLDDIVDEDCVDDMLRINYLSFFLSFRSVILLEKGGCLFGSQDFLGSGLVGAGWLMRKFGAWGIGCRDPAGGTRGLLRSEWLAALFSEKPQTAARQYFG